MLSIKNIEVVYNDVILVLKGLSLEVQEGNIVCLLGSNGAGKTTTLKAISGLLRPDNGDITDGEILFMGTRIDRKDAAEIVKMGIFQVMEGRRVFKDLTVEENLIAGGYIRTKGEIAQGIEKVYTYFPRLKERRKQLAGYMSGGEQQMLAIGRALMAKPKLILMDEPSLGLSPLLVKEIFKIIKQLNEIEKTTILLVEQNANMALSVSHRGYIMENGRIVLDGDRDYLLANDDVKEFYLGVSSGKKSFRDVKHYRRRKRWLS
ncbi:ABC transporter ATP-binding protein [Calditerrivibrio nitroreducens]|uniref:Amino acid/amide ABC transporter ATP-binding protein 2, HAAT family n=1 Tax=Calditerrivibrio nitroreducens (strain DSM 19672 / NBRC 101217 / Yu37-1) TaxID=768670 RepID=E4TGL3_CALNY|nr:ABC transporter ATP-binding protein [Calditerrivibrio nitroreducens]ADR19726.1 amino acid/amide ABC transporter ATP-binding protein 2, HAAT family [Calditerrivibrio nitroreducens DSM 19672]